MNLLDTEQKVSAAPKFGLQSTGPVTFITQSPGGGGYGNPMLRDPALVLRDWRDGIISEEVMRTIYGVAPSSDGRAVDNAKTGELRSAT